MRSLLSGIFNELDSAARYADRGGQPVPLSQNEPTITVKISWILVILLLVFVAIFSVQNAEVITVHFLRWEIAMSAALVIQLAAFLGALVGLVVGALSRRRRHVEPVATTPSLPPADNQPSPLP